MPKTLSYNPIVLI